MKAKKLMHFCMVALMTSMLFSCNGCEDDAYGPEGVAYSVSLNFRDNTGADLVAGLMDHSDYYILNICPEGTRYPEIHKDKFSIYLSGSGYYVMDHTFFNGMEAVPEKITYQIASQNLFGDGETHLLTISWIIPDEMIHNRHYARCVHVELDGHEVTDYSYEDTQYHDKVNKINIKLQR
jgi:hypothetical protein